jgi:hypothetical protein
VCTTGQSGGVLLRSRNSVLYECGVIELGCRAAAESLRGLSGFSTSRDSALRLCTSRLFRCQCGVLALV